MNRACGAGHATLANIESLRRADAVAVVSGQQAGLFTGPLYTIYKALSAIRLSDDLRRKGINAVPVFWVASEDHDLDEIDHVSVLQGGNGLASISYTPKQFTEGVSVGAVRFDERIDEIVTELFATVSHTEFSRDLIDEVRKSNRPGESYGTAFTKLLHRVLGRYGIIVLDPLHAGIKELAAPIFIAAIERSDEIVGAIRQRSRELEGRGYHAQVLVEEDYFPLFRHDDAGRRLALRSLGDGRFRVKGEKVDFTRDALIETARREPARFSPGVMLRPVVQDYLLPTLCYFGGGAEIAYFAQNSEAYRVLDRPVTPIFHRQSFTVVQPRERRNLATFGWTFPDLFAGKDAAILNAAEKTLSPELADLFGRVEDGINAEVDRLDERLAAADPTLAASLANRRRKISYHIAALRTKALRSEVQKDETMRRRIDALFDSLLPKGALQEREINVLTFLNNYGPNFIDWIYDSIDLNDRSHRIIEL
jgi:bacillithiol biosynthesis cysteine-adding enzyme BshC